MANKFDPTAANIISSLGIKGATVNEKLPGFVPVLDEYGMLSAEFIPASAAQLAIPALSSVAYVDPGTTVAEGLRKGSIEAPFKSLWEAARNFEPTAEALASGYAAFILAPGEYEDIGMSFASSPLSGVLTLYLIGIGEIRFAPTVAQFSISGMAAEPVSGRRPEVYIQNMYLGGNLTVASAADITLLGKTYVNVLSASAGATLRLSPESEVSQTSLPATLLANTSRIRNASSVTGDTASAALDRLGSRKIRVARIGAPDPSSPSSGLVVDGTYEDIAAQSAGNFDFFDLRGHDSAILTAINDLYARLVDIKCNSVDAQSVVADVVKTKELQMDSLVMGGYRLAVDSYGYLVVMDGSDTPPEPPDRIVLIRDTGDEGEGAVYILGVDDGRLYLAPADDDTSEPVEFLVVHDPDTGDDYRVSLSDGRLIITKVSAATRSAKAPKTQRKRGGK